MALPGINYASLLPDSPQFGVGAQLIQNALRGARESSAQTTAEMGRVAQLAEEKRAALQREAVARRNAAVQERYAGVSESGDLRAWNELATQAMADAGKEYDPELQRIMLKYGRLSPDEIGTLVGDAMDSFDASQGVAPAATAPATPEASAAPQPSPVSPSPAAAGAALPFDAGPAPPPKGEVPDRMAPPSVAGPTPSMRAAQAELAPPDMEFTPEEIQREALAEKVRAARVQADVANATSGLWDTPPSPEVQKQNLDTVNAATAGLFEDPSVTISKRAPVTLGDGEQKPPPRATVTVPVGEGPVAQIQRGGALARNANARAERLYKLFEAQVAGESGFDRAAGEQVLGMARDAAAATPGQPLNVAMKYLQDQYFNRTDNETSRYNARAVSARQQIGRDQDLPFKMRGAIEATTEKLSRQYGVAGTVQSKQLANEVRTLAADPAPMSNKTAIKRFLNMTEGKKLTESDVEFQVEATGKVNALLMKVNGWIASGQLPPDYKEQMINLAALLEQEAQQRIEAAGTAVYDAISTDLYLPFQSQEERAEAATKAAGRITGRYGKVPTRPVRTAGGGATSGQGGSIKGLTEEQQKKAAAGFADSL